MSLVNETEVKRIEFQNGESEPDWYDLKVNLGFFNAEVSRSGSWSVQETKDGKDLSDDDIVAGIFIAKQRVSKIYARLHAWSHEDPITMNNVMRIPADQAEKLFEEVEALADAARPFREPQES